MSAPSLDLQKAFYGVLKEDTTLAELMGGTVRVYDRVPNGAIFPYIQIADDQTINNTNQCGRGAEVFSRIHVWSREIGHVQAKNIAWRVRQILDRTLLLQSHKIGLHDFISVEHQTSQDGLEAQSIVTMSYKLWEL